MIKKITYSILLFTTLCFSQTAPIKYNADDLTRFTFGVHKSYYEKPSVFRENPQTNNIGSFDITNPQGFFINYKVLKYKNHSLKIGLFTSSLRQEWWYKGKVTDVITGSLDPVSSRPGGLSTKIRTLEYCIDYSYLLKIDKKWFLDLSVGFSQERNESLSKYFVDEYRAADFNLEPYQYVARSYYSYERKFIRMNYAASLGYKTDAGMLNLGVKYSIAKKQVASGQYEFFEPGVSDENQGYGFFELSGDYLSATLSFTPSKSLFKKKK